MGVLAISIVMIIAGLYFYKDMIYARYEDATLWEVIYTQLLGSRDYGSRLLYGGQTFAGVWAGKLLYKNKKSLFNKEYKNISGKSITIHT